MAEISKNSPESIEDELTQATRIAWGESRVEPLATVRVQIANALSIVRSTRLTLVDEPDHAVPQVRP